MNVLQRNALKELSDRYKVEFDERDFTPQFDLPEGYVGGWIGKNKLYVGCDLEGRISS